MPGSLSAAVHYYLPVKGKNPNACQEAHPAHHRHRRFCPCVYRQSTSRRTNISVLSVPHAEAVLVQHIPQKGSTVQQRTWKAILALSGHWPLGGICEGRGNSCPQKGVWSRCRRYALGHGMAVASIVCLVCLRRRKHSLLSMHLAPLSWRICVSDSVLSAAFAAGL